MKQGELNVMFVSEEVNAYLSGFAVEALNGQVCMCTNWLIEHRQMSRLKRQLPCDEETTEKDTVE